MKEVDTIMLATEARVLMTCDGWGDWLSEVEPDRETAIRPEDSETVKETFLYAYEGLKEMEDES